MDLLRVYYTSLDTWRVDAEGLTFTKHCAVFAYIRSLYDGDADSKKEKSKGNIPLDFL